MRDSEAVKLAKIQARTELTSQAMGLLQDPLWSTIAGFVAIHELRKHDLVGPVADDVLYAGVIAINTARTPALSNLAGSSIGSLIGTGEAVAAGVGIAAAGKVVVGGAGSAAKAIGKTASKAVETITDSQAKGILTSPLLMINPKSLENAMINRGLLPGRSNSMTQNQG